MPTEKRSSPNRLSLLRVAQGLSRKDLAEQISSRYGGERGADLEHVSERTVYRWETGETPIPPRHYSELAAIFRVSVGHLLGLDEPNGGNGDGHGLRSVA